MKFIRGVLLLVNIVCLILLCCSYLSPSVHPQTMSFVSICGLIYPWLFLANILFVIFWFITKPTYALWSFLGLIMGLSFINNFIGTNFNETLDAADFVIGTFNMQNAIGTVANREKDQPALDKKLEGYLEHLDKADILCGQEISFRAHKEIGEKLSLAHNNRVLQKESVIYSRFPIVNQGVITYKKYESNTASWADIKIKSDTIRVYSVHLITNKVTDAAKEVADDVIDNKWLQSETLTGLMNLFRKYRDSAALRVEQAKEIKDHMLKSPHRTILCGDFNDTPQSHVYKLLSKNLTDSFMNKGKGLGTTFAGIIPALRIDYILVEPGFKIVDHQIIKESYSDHYPIQSGIRLSEL